MSWKRRMVVGALGVGAVAGGAAALALVAGDLTEAARIARADAAAAAQVTALGAVLAEPGRPNETPEAAPVGPGSVSTQPARLSGFRRAHAASRSSPRPSARSQACSRSTCSSARPRNASAAGPSPRAIGRP